MRDAIAPHTPWVLVTRVSRPVTSLTDHSWHPMAGHDRDRVRRRPPGHASCHIPCAGSPRSRSAMARRSTLLSIAVVTALSAACGLLPQQAAPPPLPASAERSAVAVITEGSAFTRPGVTEGVMRLLEYKTGRRVFLFSPPPASTDLQW